VKGLFDGLATPQSGVVQAFITPPQVADRAGQPLGYVWGAHLAGSRQTAPRPFATMNLDWDVTFSLTQAFDQDDPNLETAFPSALDQVMALAMTTPLQVLVAGQPVVMLRDPVTGVNNNLVAFGENFTLDYEMVTTTGANGEGLFFFASDFVFRLKEVAQFLPGSYYLPNT
jgi:hypothetical protein